MTWINLGNPRPHNELGYYAPYKWPITELKCLSPPDILPQRQFVEVVMSRRSRRDFRKLTENDLSSILWLSCHCQEKKASSLGFPLEQRAVAASGAIHSIHILLQQMDDTTWWKYDPELHALASISIPEPIVQALREAASEVLPLQQATIMLFVAEPGKTFAKYDTACSLIWRDAGVLLGHLALVSEALGFQLLPLRYNW